MRSRLITALALAALAAPVVPLAAQGSMANMPGMAAAPTSGFRAEFLSNFKTVQDKFIQLAEATPADKYSWRPAAGVRSIAEVYLHVANAQYLFGSWMGIAVPAGIDQKTFETSTTDKAKVVAAVKAAFANFNAGVMAMPDASADKTANVFGQTMTMRGILLFETDHNAEHLGQSIAYARMNGVIPPWSMKAGN